MTIEKFSTFYENYFQPAYADLVSFIADKPQQITFEIENSFSHIMVYHSNDSNISQTKKDENLQKAYSHLVRATIDSYKILWVEISNILDKAIDDKNHRALSFNASEAETIKVWNEFKKYAKYARQNELKNIGIDPEKTINEYKKTIEIGMQLFNDFDYEKYKKVEKSIFKHKTKDYMFTFIIGIITGVISGVILGLFF